MRYWSRTIASAQVVDSRRGGIHLTPRRRSRWYEPVQVSVVALDPVLEVGVKGILCRSPDVALVLPHEVARVAVVVVRSAA